MHTLDHLLQYLLFTKMPSTASSWPTWPTYDESDRLAVLEVIESNQLFARERVAAFEADFSKYLTIKHSVGVGNATQGLHLSLAAIGVGQGDEVIVPNYSFISTASCVLMQNAIPIFVDLVPETLAPSVAQIKSAITHRTKAVIVTHLWGTPCHIDQIRDLCNEYSLFLIEDASHAHGALYNHQSVGTFSDISVFSLHQRKNLPVGDGGVCCTNDTSLRDKIYRLRSFGDCELSYNYRMTEFAGALGSSRLKRLDKENSDRQSIAAVLHDHASSSNYFDTFKPLPNSTSVYHSFLYFFDTERLSSSLDSIISKAHALAIPFRKTWEPLHIHPHFNPVNPPARGIPWSIDKDFVPYKDQLFPAGDSLISKSILQIDIHPGTTSENICSLTTFLDSLS